MRRSLCIIELGLYTDIDFYLPVCFKLYRLRYFLFYYIIEFSLKNTTYVLFLTYKTCCVVSMQILVLYIKKVEVKYTNYVGSQY